MPGTSPEAAAAGCQQPFAARRCPAPPAAAAGLPRGRHTCPAPAATWAAQRLLCLAVRSPCTAAAAPPAVSTGATRFSTWPSELAACPPTLQARRRLALLAHPAPQCSTPEESLLVTPPSCMHHSDTCTTLPVMQQVAPTIGSLREADSTAMHAAGCGAACMMALSLRPATASCAPCSSKASTAAVWPLRTANHSGLASPATVKRPRSRQAARAQGARKQAGRQAAPQCSR